MNEVSSAADDVDVDAGEEAVLHATDEIRAETAVVFAMKIKRGHLRLRDEEPAGRDEVRAWPEKRAVVGEHVRHARGDARLDPIHVLLGDAEAGGPVSPEAIDEREIIGCEPAFRDDGELKEEHVPGAAELCGTAMDTMCEKRSGASVVAA
jgi:hypothetical protein